MISRVFLAVAIAIVTTPYQSTDKVAPFFSEASGFGFAVQCMSSDGPAGPPKIEVRLDGMPQPKAMSGAGSLGSVRPGQAWQALVTIHRELPRATASLGFAVHRSLVAQLTPGRHTISFQCGKEWSPEYSFYMDQYPR